MDFMFLIGLNRAANRRTGLYIHTHTLTNIYYTILYTLNTPLSYCLGRGVHLVIVVDISSSTVVWRVAWSRT